MGGFSLFHWIIVLILLAIPALIVWLVLRAESKRAASTAPTQSAATSVRPWVRYWARMLDIDLACVVSGLIIGVAAPDAFKQPGYDQLFVIACIFAWVFIESFLLSTVGTTPGKWLFKIQLVPPNGVKPTYSVAFSRSSKVWWRGLGIGFPLASLVTLILAYSNLTRNGITSWDREDGFTVIHHHIGVLRVLVAVMFFALFFALVVVGNAVGA